MTTAHAQNAALAAAGSSLAAPALPPAVKDLIEQIQSDKEDVRAKAWQHAFIAGPAAIKPLAPLVTHSELEVGRAAKRAMWKIVRHAGRPGATLPQARVVSELVALSADGNQPVALRREVLWMLSELGGDESVDTVAALLSNAELREDARMVLERIPGDRSLAALNAALAAAPDDFKPNLAQSLRRRGAKVPGLPCRKLVPTRKTKVKPVGR